MNYTWILTESDLRDVLTLAYEHAATVEELLDDMRLVSQRDYFVQDGDKLRHLSEDEAFIEELEDGDT